MASFADNYFSRRWRGQVPLAVLLWRDMLGVGTLINLTGTMLALEGTILLPEVRVQALEYLIFRRVLF